MARLEHDPIHAGEWHCHACCEDSANVTRGIIKHAPSCRDVRLTMPRHLSGFDVTPLTALPIALDIFGIVLAPPEEGLFDAQG